jgi:hypothetical protein
MFRGCISYYGVGTLTPVEGYMNTEKYISVLDYNLWPFFKPTGFFRMIMHRAMFQLEPTNGRKKII